MCSLNAEGPLGSIGGGKEEARRKQLRASEFRTANGRKTTHGSLVADLRVVCNTGGNPHRQWPLRSAPTAVVPLVRNRLLCLSELLEGSELLQ
jgi:hypothetical protein